MNRCALALLLATCGAPVALADNALTVIDSCIHRLDPNLDVGYARVAERCPDLTRSLASGPYAAWLPHAWNKPDNDLSVAGLAELRALLARPEPAPAANAPRVAQLGSVLAELQRSDAAPRTWWARFREWLREFFMPQPQGGGGGWFQRLMGSLDVSQTALRAIVWGALFLVVLLAGAIVVNELRVATGLRDARGRRRKEPGAPQREPAAPSLQDVDRASPAEQPHLLLQLITQRLIEQHRLPPARALTLRELERSARLPGEADHDRLAALAGACERARFADHVAAALLAAAARRGRELLASLDRPARLSAGGS
jgi:hypothetical protein